MKKTIYIAAVTIFALSCKEKEADKTVIEDVVSVNESVMKMPNEEVILFCDEVGRGPIAGPVNSCAVIFKNAKDFKRINKYLIDLFK